MSKNDTANIVERTKNKWNRTADEFNQWDSLDVNEILDLIIEEDLGLNNTCSSETNKK